MTSPIQFKNWYLTDTLDAHVTAGVTGSATRLMDDYQQQLRHRVERSVSRVVWLSTMLELRRGQDD